MTIYVENGSLSEIKEIENETIVVLPDNMNIKSVSTDTIFGEYPDVKKLVLSEGVEELIIENWDYSCEENMNKKSIYIPNSVKSIDLFCEFIKLECTKLTLERICRKEIEFILTGSPSDCQYILFDLKNENQKIIVPVSNSMSGQFQCTLPWHGEKLDFESYDIHLRDNTSGHKYKQKERLWAMLLRLQYPVELSADNKIAFVSYLTKNVKKVLKELADEMNEESIRVFVENGIINKKNKKVAEEIINEMCNDSCKETMKGILI